jgi:hypothetical protein
MTKKNYKFVQEIQFFIDKTSKKMDTVKKLAIFQLFSDIVDDTPIWFLGTKITGNAKWNWQISIGSFNPRVLKGTESRTGKKTKDRAYAKLMKMVGDEDIYIHNSVPQIMRLEYGGYTKSPVLGSRNPKTGEYEIRTSGGFSKQSPLGMVRINVLQWNVTVNNATKVVSKT